MRKERPSVIRQLGVRAQNGFDECGISEAEPAQFVDHPCDADLVFLVDSDQRTLVAVVGDSEMGDERSQNAAVVDADAATFEPECCERRRGRGDELDLGECRRFADDVDIALHELTEPPLLWPLSPPDRRDLNRPENLRQLRLMRRVEPRKRHRQIEPQTQIGEVEGVGCCGQILRRQPTLQHAEGKLFIVAAEAGVKAQRVFHHGGLDLVEPVCGIHGADGREHPFPPGLLRG